MIKFFIHAGPKNLNDNVYDQKRKMTICSGPVLTFTLQFNTIYFDMLLFVFFNLFLFCIYNFIMVVCCSNLLCYKIFISKLFDC